MHDEIRKNRSHSRTEIQKMDTVPIQKWLKEKTCPDHPDHKLELYDNTCKKPVCLLCSKGSHKQHDVEDLQFVHGETRSALEEVIKNHQCKRDAIRELANAVEEHKTNLHQTADDLETQVVSVHQDVAGKFLHRQKQLLQDIRLSLEGPNQAVQLKLKTVHAAEQSLMTTIDYIQRATESTTKIELISLRDAIQKKASEDLKIELPTDDTRDTRIRLSFQGQKALEEIIEEFGSLASCTQMDHFTDIQPTVRDLCRKMNRLTERPTLTSTELKQAREMITVDEVKITRLQSVCSFLEQGIPIFYVKIAEGEDVASNLVSCPAMTLDTNRVNRKFHVSEDGLELEYTKRRGQSRGDIGGFSNYRGTCSRLPIPLPPSPSTLTTPRYWETHTRVRVVKRVEAWLTLLEMGLCQEGKVDTDYWVSLQPRNSWAVWVGVCDTHGLGLCTRVYRKGKQVGKCCAKTMSHTPGTPVNTEYQNFIIKS